MSSSTAGMSTSGFFQMSFQGNFEEGHEESMQQDELGEPQLGEGLDARLEEMAEAHKFSPEAKKEVEKYAKSVVRQLRCGPAPNSSGKKALVPGGALFDWTQCKSEGGAAECALCDDAGGVLPCSRVEDKTKGKVGQKSSECRDDKMMTNRKWWFYLEGRNGWSGWCMDFANRRGTYTLTGNVVSTWKFPFLGSDSMVATKAWITHPQAAHKRVGVFMFKRLVSHRCTGRAGKASLCTKGTIVADVYKYAICVRCDYDVFKNRWAGAVNNTHRTSFSNRCLKRAIVNNKVHKGFRCTKEDLKYAQAAIAAF